MNLFKKPSAVDNELPLVLQKTHFPTLDGLRCVAILLVILFHLDLSESKLYKIFFNGDLGVDVFFVLSGFLITTLCLKEISITGNLNLKKFYIRRILRIMPVAYLYLIIIFFLNLILNLKLDYVNFLGAGLFIYNLAFFRHYQNSIPIAHYWSLASEEQFYMFFPPILKRNFGVFVTIILFLVLLLPIILYTQNYLPRLNHGLLLLITHYLIKFHGIACGCLFSIIVFNGGFDNLYKIKGRLFINIFIAIIVVLLNYQTNYTPKDIFPNAIASLLIGLFISLNIFEGNDVIYKVLNSKLFSRIGILSYSIYIWQQIFVFPILPTPLKIFPYNLIFLAIVSSASYYLYERYFINLKRKFQKISN